MKINYLLSIPAALCFLFVFTACDKEDQEIGASKDLYFEANLAGKSLYLPEGKDGYTSGASAAPFENALGCIEIQNMSIGKNDGRKSIQVSFVKQQSTCDIDCEESMGMVQEGTYTFGNVATSPDNFIEGVVISYVDVDGKLWRTDFGLGQQGSSNFRITKIEANTLDASGKFFVTAEFNCTLYDGEGNEIEVTDGEMVSRAILCQ